MSARTCCPRCHTWIDLADECGLKYIPWHKGRFGLWCNGEDPTR